MFLEKNHNFTSKTKQTILLGSVFITGFAVLIVEIIAIRIKPTEIEIRSKLKMTTYDSDGINVIRESLKKAQEAGKDSISISYLGSGTYHLIIKGNDYKEAEKIMEKASDAAISYVEKHAGTAELTREGE